ncbi:hypothetical protein GCM10010191_88970 [Actinomadura vinacea]|uniref:Aspartyl/asparaginy/proline hydroxylase domain-containing protein n=1 Tax=Actinomadura vinacea TaxID=115336 RepID=A0ABP5XK91_9ACTN
MNMSKFDGQVRNLGEIPHELLDPLISRIRDAEHLWVVGDSRFVKTLDDSRHIVLSFPDRYPDNHYPASFTEHWPEWKPLVEPVIDLVRERYGFTDAGLAKIMFSALNARACVPLHVDTNLSSRVPHKVHVPLITDSSVHFVIDGTRHHLALGQAYEINNLLPHSVENGSDHARVHLIFEIYQKAPV